MTFAGTTPLSIKLNIGIHERLKIIAKEKRRSVHWLMKEAVEKYLLEQEEEFALQKECEESYREYIETGLHLSEKEVLDWVARWKPVCIPRAPDCHR